LIIALDVSSGEEGRSLVEKIGPAGDFYKVAPTLALTEPAFIPWLVARGKRVFLDCKWHDIPSQVRRSVETAGRLGVTSCTIHAGAGRDVMRAALAAQGRPWVWGVTVLTSLGAEDLREVGVDAVPEEQVLRLARLAQSVGLNGLVCSAQEVSLLRKNGITLPLVTPGIQFGATVNKDQKRTASPREAWSAGADYLVVGRSILDAPDPAAVVKAILAERPR
jgi:orotidine-5'-phosphate decarboxylase